MNDEGIDIEEYEDDLLEPSEQNKTRRKKHEEPPPKPDRLYDYLEARFGIPKNSFEGYCLYLGSKNKIYLGPKSAPDKLKIICIGISIARMDGGIKPTTNLFQVFGNLVTANFVELGLEQAMEYVKGGDLTILEQKPSVSDGYVLLRYQSNNLGCGLLKNGIVKNMLPKARRMKLNYL